MAGILIVDDDWETLEALSEDLGNQGYHIDTASSAEEAVERVSLEPYDVIVCEVMMPGVNGLSLVDSIREYAPEARVILVSGAPSWESLLRSIECDSFAYVEKPRGVPYFSSIVRMAAGRIPTQCLAMA